MWTTIRISRDTLARFNEQGKRGESQEAIMARILDAVEGKVSGGNGDLPSAKGGIK